MQTTNIKAFIPSNDYAVSQRFYTEIGFTPEYVSNDLTLFQNGECVFFLQRFYNQELARNFMLQICVTDIQDAYNLCAKSTSKTKITPIQQEPWGKVFYLWGPSDELLHITQLGK